MGIGATASPGRFPKPRGPFPTFSGAAGKPFRARVDPHFQAKSRWVESRLVKQVRPGSDSPRLGQVLKVGLTQTTMAKVLLSPKEAERRLKELRDGFVPEMGHGHTDRQTHTNPLAVSQIPRASYFCPPGGCPRPLQRASAAPWHNATRLGFVRKRRAERLAQRPPQIGAEARRSLCNSSLARLPAGLG